MNESYLDDVNDYDDQTGEDELDPVEIPKEVRHLRTQSYDKSVRDLVAMIDEGDIDLDPDYQRNYLWENKKASLLIESILLNIPIPVVYVAENEESQWNVIDGLQRLNSLYRFFKNEFKLSRLEVLSELNGLTYHNLPPKAKRMLGNGMFRVVVLLAETHPEIKYDVFMRLNTGSVRLNEQELRNCLYRGKFNDFLKECRFNEKFLACLKLKDTHKRFVDAELVLRFLAIRENYDLNTYTLNYPGRMKTFLNMFMAKYQNIDTEKMAEFGAAFNGCMDNIYSVLGDTAFRRPDKYGNHETRINRSLIDVIMLCFSHLTMQECEENKEVYQQNIVELCEDENFLDAITYGTADSKRIMTRLELGLKKFGIVEDARTSVI
ncbi:MULTISPECIES: DUF262 domain-containing protein [Alteromonas]|uniref:DUF262 domain-containing protein n=1 Tax=Alteromonas TaxID=226 RepID=UPI0012744B4F|nr:MULTISPECIES: DUF262 domain-containing protein [Alteromonas]CAI2388390.1 Protein of unknown function DUF262 [Alteromonas macleodii]CAI3927809.1 Protein of unknown function DUF262 [Alteromonas macleodii]CAI3927974.1 Protein of unknown function DUF262 [Alteromonas macleodii]CAI3928054.1 Protein of unknown function DUF262 [Alteromonas macleodii]VTO37986.1 Protein of unknown function DUF262 [Alteromonas macleodii]|tara:strand:- start:961 stop:2094 length:1134 start_codon:yes stop_codon:yes gene_type:complete